jgi:hypothetical protein
MIRIMKLKRMRWAGPVASMGLKTTQDFPRKLQLGKPSHRRILEEENGLIWAILIWLNIGTNQTLGSIKFWEILE